MKKTFKYYDIILAVFAAILLISNLAGTKLIAFGPIITDGGAILFPISYILGDVLTEIYGYKYARRAIWVGLGVMLLAVLCFTLRSCVICHRRRSMRIRLHMKRF